jgi:hypothetical protein
MITNDNKNEIKIPNSEAQLTIIYLCIPVILQVQVRYCHGMPKSTTVPVLAIPFLETLWVFPCPCPTLARMQVRTMAQRWREQWRERQHGKDTTRTQQCDNATRTQRGHDNTTRTQRGCDNTMRMQQGHDNATTQRHE